MPDKRKPMGRHAPLRTGPTDNAGSEGFDASPNAPDSLPVPFKSPRPKSVMDTKIWKESMGGAGRFWFNYTNTLKTAFNRMDRRQQEELVTRMSQIITVGAAVVTTYVWYWFMPQVVRVFVLPVVLVGSWWVGTRIVAPNVIQRLESHMHPDE